MKYLYLLMSVCSTLVGFSQNDSITDDIDVYFFSGHGSDSRIFEKITLDSNYHLIYASMPEPDKDATIHSYAKSLVYQIDTTKRFILIGVSFGGMVCTELTEILHPEKTIIMSSAKCRSELPGLYRFQKYVPVNKMVPKGMVKQGARILQPIVEPDRKKNKIIFKSMLKEKSPVFFKRVANVLVNWDREQYNTSIIHIHGSKDHTLPLRNIDADYIIKDGSHMMALTRGEELNLLILKVLNEER